MNRCMQEQCLNWTGQGCLCAVMNVEPEGLHENEEQDSAPTCDRCDDPARFGVQPENVDTLYSCARHLADVAVAVIEAWGEHGVITLFDATED